MTELHLMPQLQCLQQLQIFHFVSITLAQDAQRRQRPSIRRCQSSTGSTLPELQQGAAAYFHVTDSSTAYFHVTDFLYSSTP